MANDMTPSAFLLCLGWSSVLKKGPSGFKSGRVLGEGTFDESSVPIFLWLWSRRTPCGALTPSL